MKIYCYTTKQYSVRSTSDVDGTKFPVRLKVGETMLDIYDRVAQQDGTASAETPTVVFGKENVPDHITDKKLHKALKRKGYLKSRDDKDREWFDFPDCLTAADAVKIVQETLNELIHGKIALEDWDSFEYQQQIVDWAVDRLQSSPDVLVNAIMRAGKCRISYEIARALGAKKILVVTAKPGVNDSWSALLPGGEESHVNYAGWKYHNYKKVKKLTLNNDVDVVFVSLQFLNKHFNSNTTIYNQIVQTSWDIVFFDEQHYATTTDNTQRLWNTIKFNYKLELSGTPYKTLLSGRYDDEDVYNFDYENEQKIRKAVLSANANEFLVNEFKKRADINFALITVSDKVKALLGEDGFTHSKLFATDNDGNLLNPMSVNEYLLAVEKNYKKPPAGFRKVADKLCRHTLWILPDNVKSAKAIERLLQNHPFFGKRKIINATGNGVKDIEKVKDAIARVDQNTGAGTITLTCGRFLEGTTVPEWWSVHQMNDDKSAADYFQGSFRCKSVQNGKESVLVFDYNPERFIGTVYSYCEASSTSEKSTNIRISEWLDVSEVYDYTGNTWTILSGEAIASRFLQDIKNHIDRIGKFVNFSQIDNTIIALLDGKQKGKNFVGSDTHLNENEILTGKNKSTVSLSNSSNSNKDDTQDDLHVTVQRIRYALKQIFKLVDIAWAEDYEITTVDDILNYDDSLVAEITNLTTSEWNAIINVLDVIGINRAIGQYRDC